MTWDSDDVKFYEGHNCAHCGEFEANQWLPERAQAIAESQLCHTCHYWREQRQNGDNVVITNSYEHYRLEDPLVVNTGFAGFGGREFVVFWKDDRVSTVTRNLWSQGEIPENMREFFEPNAQLISSYEILKKAHYVELLNL